jgi:hypothetical protein
MVIAEIDKHVINLGLPKSSNELLTAYQGREYELFRMLRRMERKMNEQMFSCWKVEKRRKDGKQLQGIVIGNEEES